jgi:hypothetical protein
MKALLFAFCSLLFALDFGPSLADTITPSVGRIPNRGSVSVEYYGNCGERHICKNEERITCRPTARAVEDESGCYCSADGCT